MTTEEAYKMYEEQLISLINGNINFFKKWYFGLKTEYQTDFMEWVLDNYAGTLPKIIRTLNR